MHSRRGRPTLRVLKEDLRDGWQESFVMRAVGDERYEDLLPLSELAHPIIRKTAESFTDTASADNYVGAIGSAVSIRLLEIKQSQWRGGVWTDPGTGVCWLVAAGRAKGGHEDNDDFYKFVEREEHNGTITRLLPTEDDKRLLKLETAARIRTEWELNIQREVLVALQEICGGGIARFDVNHPLARLGRFATVELYVELVRGEDRIAADEVIVEFFPQRGVNFNEELYWQLIVRVLASVYPPAQGWDRVGDAFHQMEEPGSLDKRISELETHDVMRTLAEVELGAVAHFTHREHLASKIIDGTGVRSLCGVYFVPTQDADSLPACPQCEALYAALPKLPLGN